MKKHTWILFFLLLGFFACNDDNSHFEVTTEGTNIKFTPVAGGAIMHYALPNNSDIFAINIRYTDWQGQEVLKTCGYSGDSVLLDGFTRAQESRARLSFVNQRNEESKAQEYTFKTLDSAPWEFFNDIKVSSSWNGFQIIYKSPSVVTGMVHVFYLGTNPLTQKEDTILVNSFPILRGGDTLNFALKQENLKNTVVVRTEDFKGYRVRQEVYPDVDAFLTEKWQLTPDGFKGLSVENAKAKTGVQYLFDGELKGLKRLMASKTEERPFDRLATTTYETFLSGPKAYEKPLTIDLKEQKIPAWVRLYCLYPMRATHPAGQEQELSEVWMANYDDKIPCHMSVYGSKTSSNPNSNDWVFLGELKQEPKVSAVKDRWSYLTTMLSLAPKDEHEMALVDPIYVDIQFPVVNEAYRYLKIVVHDTFDSSGKYGINYNQNEYFTLHELEVYVKKN